MTEVSRAKPPGGGVSCDDDGAMFPRGVAKWLRLAAAPTFAVMAVATSVLDWGPMDMLRSAGHGSTLAGMSVMYVLMSAFHAAPWVHMISGRRREPR